MNSATKTSSMGFLTFLLIVGILIGYIHQMAPAPFFDQIAAFYSIDPVSGQAQLNSSISITFLFIIFACLVGGILEKNIGTRNLFTVSLICNGLSMLMYYVAINFNIFLISRALYGFGFGLAIPVIGSAIMKWYAPKTREKMTTVNGLFPFVGTVINFGLFVPISLLFDISWRGTLGLWGIGSIIIAILWITFIKKDVDTFVPEGVTIKTYVVEKGLYVNLWKRREIKLLCITFVCDFCCYAYVAAVLPTLMLNSGNVTPAEAGVWAAIAFPAVGIIGALIGGFHISKTGKRKPSMALGQLLKFVGISCIALLGPYSFSFIIMGTALFGLGNSMWMPGMYVIPTELPDMNPTRVGGAFAFISSCGFVSGVVAPIAGGWISQALINASSITEQSAQIAYGLGWSLFVFGFLNLIGFFCIVALRETGPGARVFKTDITE